MKGEKLEHITAINFQNPFMTMMNFAASCCQMKHEGHTHLVLCILVCLTEG